MAKDKSVSAREISDKVAAAVKKAVKKPVVARKKVAPKIAKAAIGRVKTVDVVAEKTHNIVHAFEPVQIKRVIFSRPAVQDMLSDTIHTCPHNHALIQPRLVRLGQRAASAWLGYAKDKLADSEYTESVVGEVIHVNGSIAIKPGDAVVTHYPMGIQTYAVVPVDRLVKVDTISANYLTSPAAYLNYVVDSTKRVFEENCTASWRKVIIIGSTAIANLLANKYPNAVHYESRKFALLAETFDVVFDCRPVPDVINAARFVSPGGLYVSVATGRVSSDVVEDDSVTLHTHEDGVQVKVFTPTQSSVKYLPYWLKSLGQSNPLLTAFTDKGKLSNVVTPLGGPKMNIILDMVN